MRVVVITDIWPTEARPGLAPWVLAPAALLAERGIDVRVVFLRRVFPPRSLMPSRKGARSWLRGMGDWWRSLVARPLRPELVTSVRYTAPPSKRWNHTWGRWALLLRGGRLRRLAAVNEDTFLLGHYAVPSGFVCRALSNWTGRPFVVAVHGADLDHTAALPGGREVVGAVLADASVVIANSGASSARVREIIGDQTRIEVIWQGGKPLPEEPSSPDRVGASRPRVITVGHLHPSKGILEAVELLGRVRRSGIEFEWSIVGTGSDEYREMVLDRLLAEGLSRDASLLGEVDNTSVERLMRSADVFVLLSRRDSYGVAYAEALCAGLAVVGSPCAGAVKDFVAAGAPIRVCDPDDADSMRGCAADLARVLGEPSMLLEERRAAYRWAAEHLGWDLYVDRLVGLLSDVAEWERGPR